MTEPSLRAAARRRCSRSAPSYIASGTSVRCCASTGTTLKIAMSSTRSIRSSLSISSPVRVIYGEAFLGREVHVRAFAGSQRDGRMRAHVQDAFADAHLEVDMLAEKYLRSHRAFADIATL